MQSPTDTTVLGNWRCVAFVEDFFDILDRVHAKEKGHVGVKKTIVEVCLSRSYFVMKGDAQKYVTSCK